MATTTRDLTRGRWAALFRKARRSTGLSQRKFATDIEAVTGEPSHYRSVQDWESGTLPDLHSLRTLRLYFERKGYTEFERQLLVLLAAGNSCFPYTLPDLLVSSALIPRLRGKSPATPVSRRAIFG